MASKKAGKTSVRTPTKRRGHPQTNANSLANLKPPWKKGDPSPNPGGRPKGMSDAYKEWLATVNENDPLGRTNAQLGAASIGLEMLKGDVSAAKEIRSATEGDKIEQSGAVTLKVIYDDKRIDNPPPAPAPETGGVHSEPGEAESH